MTGSGIEGEALLYYMYKSQVWQGIIGHFAAKALYKNIRYHYIWSRRPTSMPVAFLRAECLGHDTNAFETGSHRERITVYSACIAHYLQISKPASQTPSMHLGSQNRSESTKQVARPAQPSMKDRREGKRKAAHHTSSSTRPTSPAYHTPVRYMSVSPAMQSHKPQLHHLPSSAPLTPSHYILTGFFSAPSALPLTLPAASADPADLRRTASVPPSRIQLTPSSLMCFSPVLPRCRFTRVHARTCACACAAVGAGGP
jgi:hypothetical protein